MMRTCDFFFLGLSQTTCADYSIFMWWTSNGTVLHLFHLTENPWSGRPVKTRKDGTGTRGPELPLFGKAPGRTTFSFYFWEGHCGRLPSAWALCSHALFIARRRTSRFAKSEQSKSAESWQRGAVGKSNQRPGHEPDQPTGQPRAGAWVGPAGSYRPAAEAAVSRFGYDGCDMDFTLFLRN
jgi:hypothetical protein